MLASALFGAMDMGMGTGTSTGTAMVMSMDMKTGMGMTQGLAHRVKTAKLEGTKTCHGA